MIATPIGRHFSSYAFLVYFLLVSGFATAQDDGAEEGSADKRPLMQVDMKVDDRIPEGKSAFIQGTADKLGDKYLVEGIEINQPIHVGIFTQNTEDNVHVRIIKDDWEKSEKEQNTEGTGKAEFKFRTFDNFKIWVSAETETSYQLMVWIGDEVDINQPSIAVPASEYVEPKESENKNKTNPSGGVSFSYLELGLIGVVLLLLIGFAVIFLRKKN